MNTLYMGVVFTAVWYTLSMIGMHVLEIEHFAYIMVWGAFAGLISNRLSEWAIGRVRITLLVHKHKTEEGE